MNPLQRYFHRKPTPLSELMSDRIHYACGRTLLPGWLNVDGIDESYPMGKVDKQIARQIFRMDLTTEHPFPDNSFVFGYSEDFLEHIDQGDSLIFLCEAYRTLTPGGVLRISCPGLKNVLRRHLRSSDYAGGATCREEAYTSWWHKHFYCFESLKLVAEHIGFSDMRQCEYGKSDHPELLHDSRPDQADLNLVVELTK